MPEHLYCLVKDCNNDKYRDINICREHFYNLSKNRRDEALAIHRLFLTGEIKEEQYLYLIRQICSQLEHETIVLTTPKLTSRIQSVDRFKGNRQR
ncbi:MAG: hypothetical protein AB1489_18410 [Acidobacteriota bacterium]